MLAGFGALELELDAQSNPDIFDTLSQLSCSHVLAKVQRSRQRSFALRAGEEPCHNRLAAFLGPSHSCCYGILSVSMHC